MYLQSLGHNVVAVDKSEVSCTQLKEFIVKNNIENIRVECRDVSGFEIEKSKYAIINIQNTLQFLDKEESLRIIKNIKESLLVNGLAIVSLFTVEDDSFRNGNKGIKSHFGKQELLNEFRDFEIVYYLEARVPDRGHPGFEESHYHGVAKIVARKS